MVSQTTARHTLTQCGFVVFGSIALTQQNGCMGAYRVIDSEQFPVRISKDKTPTPLTKFGICSFFFFFFCHSPFFLCLYLLVRFMAFQSVLVGTTLAFTIIINSTKRYLFRPIYHSSLIRSHCALQHSPTFSTLIEKISKIRCYISIYI